QFAVFRIGLAIGVQSPLRRLTPKRRVKLYDRKRNRTVHGGEIYSEKGVQFVVDFTHPAKARGYHEIVPDCVRVGKKEAGAKTRFSFQVRELGVHVNSAVAAGHHIVAVAPVTSGELLPLGEIVIDGKAPIRLARGQHAYTGGGIVGRSRIVRRGHQRQETGGGGTGAGGGDRVARPRRARSGS